MISAATATIASFLLLVASLAGAQETRIARDIPERPDGSWRVVFSLRAQQDVGLRSGEKVRPRLMVECNGNAARMSFDLAPLRPESDRPASPLTGRIQFVGEPGDTIQTRRESVVVWQPEHQPGLYSIPDSSAWIRGLAGATRFAFVPDSAGALAEQVEFDLRVVGPWRDAIERCRGMKPPPTDPRSESTTGRSPAYGEYIYVEEFPEAISKVSPHYPDALRGTGREGTVVVQALVNKEGRIVDTKIARSNPDFDAAAEEAVRQYRFKPARAKGQPVAVWIAVPIRFVTD